jgi:hypothetical protein
LRATEASLGGNSFSKVKNPAFELKEEDEKMIEEGKSFIGLFNSFLVHNFTFQNMHSASISSIG